LSGQTSVKTSEVALRTARGFAAIIAAFQIAWALRSNVRTYASALTATLLRNHLTAGPSACAEIITVSSTASASDSSRGGTA